MGITPPSSRFHTQETFGKSCPCVGGGTLNGKMCGQQIRTNSPRHARTLCWSHAPQVNCRHHFSPHGLLPHYAFPPHSRRHGNELVHAEPAGAPG